MKTMYYRGTAVILVLMAFLLTMNGLRRRDEAIVSRLAPEVLRFHVLANSDSAEDRALKLAVKDFMLEEIRAALEAEAGADSAAPLSKDMVEQFVLDEKFSLETAAELFITDCGFDYPVDIRLESCDFPVRTYGDIIFPAGTYDAVRVLIGDGAGENFWCVLYPSLCYLDSAYAIVPDESKAILQAVLPEADFQTLLSARHSADIRLDASNQNGSGKFAVMNAEKKGQDLLLPQVTFRSKLADLFRKCW